MSTCPGCGVELERDPTTVAHAYINCSPECWAVFGEVLAREYGNPELFASVHQLTVDAYAAQHPGRAHPDRSVATHLVGLLLALERGVRPADIVQLRGRLLERVQSWPRLPPPATRGEITVVDVAAAPAERHAAAVEAWALEVWRAWAPRHDVVRGLVARL